jgi:CO/xanthine dehydrogenase FAD-binding subunit
MKPSPFELLRPERLTDVLDLLSTHDDAKLIAGGQSLMPLMNLRMAAPAVLIDLNRVEGLAGITLEGAMLRIGAMTRQKNLFGHPLIESHAPLIAAAMPHVGHVQTRNRGMVGGSLSHADPAAELPLVMTTLRATFVIQSARGMREIAAGTFFVDALTTAIEPDEVLTEVKIPVAPGGTRVAFREYARRHGDFAIAAAAVQVSNADGAVALRAGLGGVAPTPLACDELSAALSGGDGVTKGRLSEFVEAEIARLDPQTDLQASGDYRRTLARLALTDCLREVMS